MDSRTKKVSLEFMGDAWKECYVELRYITWADSKRMVDMDEEFKDDFIQAMTERIKQVFVSGKVLDDGKAVDLTADGIAAFDMEALKELNNAALGLVGPKE